MSHAGETVTRRGEINNTTTSSIPVDVKSKVNMSDLEISSDDEHYDQEANHFQNRCATCGSSRFYRDTETDNLICSDCYTQSQTLSQRETVDLEDVFANAKSSHLRRSNLSRRSASRDEDLDNSRPLPALHTCLHACQLILKIMAEKSYILAHVHTQPSKAFQKDQEAFLNVVGDIWFRYLNAWKHAAEHYSQIFPEQRFSFRDFFLSKTLRGMVVKHLSAQSIRDLKEDGTINRNSASKEVIKSTTIDDETRKRKRVTFDDNLLEGHQKDSNTSVGNSDAKTEKLCAPHKVQSHHSVRFFRPIYRQRSVFLSHIALKEGETISKEHAALHLEPSYSLFASIVYVAFMECKMGVSSIHIRSWLSNGSIPHAKAAFVMIPKKMQDSLVLVQQFFHQNVVPTSAILEQNADLLMIACDILPHLDSKIMKHESFARSQMQGFVNVGPSKSISNLIQKIGREEKTQRSFPFIDNIPLMTLRFVADLGLPQNVLDYSLALMGLFNPDDQSSEKYNWLPPILNTASPGRIVSPVHILAVIVVACKMSEGWQRWSIFMRRTSSKDDETTVGGSPATTKRELNSIGQRFVPISESHLNLVNNGELLEQYLDFIEESVAPAIAEVPQYVHLFSTWGNFLTNNTTSQLDSQPVIQPSTVIAGIPRPLLKGTDNFLEVNGIEYIVYDDFRNHAYTKVRSGHPSLPTQTCRPFHAHYGLLIEYVSYVFSVDPSELHYLVACCDEEILKIGKKPAPRRRGESEANPSG